MEGGGFAVGGAEEGEEFGYFDEASWPCEQPSELLYMGLGT